MDSSPVSDALPMSGCLFYTCVCFEARCKGKPAQGERERFVSMVASVTARTLSSASFSLLYADIYKQQVRLFAFSQWTFGSLFRDRSQLCRAQACMSVFILHTVTPNLLFLLSLSIII